MSEQISLTGTVQVIQPIETFDSGFQKQVLVLNDGNESYPQQIPIEFVKDNIQKIAHLQVGQQVTVGINIRGNEYKGKYYCNIVGWKVDAREMGQTQAQPAPAQQPDQAPPF